MAAELAISLILLSFKTLGEILNLAFDLFDFGVKGLRKVRLILIDFSASSNVIALDVDALLENGRLMTV